MSQTFEPNSNSCNNEIKPPASDFHVPFTKASQNNEPKRRVSKFSDAPPANGSRPSKFSDRPPDAIVAPKVDAVQAAAAAAARINALLRAKGKLSDETLLKPVIPVAQSTNSVLNMIQISPTTKLFDLFVAKIDINNLPSNVRVYFSQSQVHESLNKQTGATVSLKGQYMSPDEKSRLTGIEKQLHLCIQSPVKLHVDMALSKLRDMISKHPVSSGNLGNVTSAGSLSQNVTPQLPSLPVLGQPTLPTGNYMQEKVFVAMGNAPEDFDLKTKLIGQNYTNFNFIANSTGAKVILRGRGSGFIEPTSGREAFEAMYVFISHPTQAGVDNARKFVQNLIDTVRTDLANHMSQKVGGHFASTTNSFPSQNFVPYPPPSNLPPPSSTYNNIPSYPYYSNHTNPTSYNIPVQTPMPVPPTQAPSPVSFTHVPPPVPSVTTPPIASPEFKTPKQTPPEPLNKSGGLMLPPPVPATAKAESKPTKRRRFQEEVPDDSALLGYKQVSTSKNEPTSEEKPKKSKRIFKEDLSVTTLTKKEEKVNKNLPFWMSHNYD